MHCAAHRVLSFCLVAHWRVSGCSWQRPWMGQCTHSLYAFFYPGKTLQLFIFVLIWLCFSDLILKGLRSKPFSNPSQSPISWAYAIRPFTADAVENVKFWSRYFLLSPIYFFSKSWIIFTICAEKVCYKVCNTYYKVCNMYYKVSNMRYKLCNKNFHIG